MTRCSPIRVRRMAIGALGCAKVAGVMIGLDADVCPDVMSPLVALAAFSQR